MRLLNDLPTAYRRALLYLWITVSVLALLAVAAVWVLPQEMVYRMSDILSIEHPPGSCPFCGMTRALLCLTQGDWCQAQEWNATAMPLFGAILLNSGIFFLFWTYCMVKWWNRT